MQTINKHTMLKQVRETGAWRGFIAPNKVNEFHINGGWKLGKEIEILWHAPDGCYRDYFVQTMNGLIKLSEILMEFKYYNCNNELGNDVRYWIN